MATPPSSTVVHVVSSGGITPAYQQLAPQFEQATGLRLVSVLGDSMGATPTAIPHRLQRGEPLDVVLLVDDEFELLRQQKLVDSEVRTVLARSRIALAVRAGAPKPAIGTVAALTQTLRRAASIGYSDSASGHYLATVLFPKLGLAAALHTKAHRIDGTPVGQQVASGAVELGLQELSELRPVAGLDVAGLLPEAVQKVTLYVGGIPAHAANPVGARALLHFLAAPAAAAVIRATGLEPVAAPVSGPPGPGH